LSFGAIAPLCDKAQTGEDEVLVNKKYNIFSGEDEQQTEGVRRS
jgi:hypothetical protein